MIILRKLHENQEIRLLILVANFLVMIKENISCNKQRLTDSSNDPMNLPIFVGNYALEMKISINQSIKKEEGNCDNQYTSKRLKTN